MTGIASPCIRNCCLDHEDICIGCLRSMTEIIAWHGASEQEKREILTRCDARREERASRSKIRK